MQYLLSTFTRQQTTVSLLLLGTLFGVGLRSSAQDAPDPARAMKNFDTSYQAAVDAIAEKDWGTAEVLLEAALKSLGSAGHPNKLAAETLLAKAQFINKLKKDAAEALRAAEELLRLKQWAEAEALFKKALALAGESEGTRKGIAAAQAGLKEASASRTVAAGSASGATPAVGVQQAEGVKKTIDSSASPAGSVARARGIEPRRVGEGRRVCLHLVGNPAAPGRGR